MSSTSNTSIEDENNIDYWKQKVIELQQFILDMPTGDRSSRVEDSATKSNEMSTYTARDVINMRVDFQNKLVKAKEESAAALAAKDNEIKELQNRVRQLEYNQVKRVGTNETIFDDEDDFMAMIPNEKRGSNNVTTNNTSQSSNANKPITSSQNLISDTELTLEDDIFEIMVSPSEVPTDLSLTKNNENSANNNISNNINGNNIAKNTAISSTNTANGSVATTNKATNQDSSSSNVQDKSLNKSTNNNNNSIETNIKNGNSNAKIASNSTTPSTSDSTNKPKSRLSIILVNRKLQSAFKLNPMKTYILAISNSDSENSNSKTSDSSTMMLEFWKAPESHDSPSRFVTDLKSKQLETLSDLHKEFVKCNCVHKESIPALSVVRREKVDSLTSNVILKQRSFQVRFSNESDSSEFANLMQSAGK